MLASFLIMKLWSDTQTFFVVDTEFCQNEADDPQDAIIYFSPKDTPDTTKCTLCCHIMGICRFMKLGFSPVSLIRLSKGKFAIRTLGKYLLALRGGPDMPDSILQRQLNSMMEIFLLLYNGFENVANEYNSRADFLEKMSDVWSFLLPISQHRGDNLSLTFNIIPSLDLPKTAGLLFLQASQFLQSCQRLSGVYAGMLFCDQKVLCSQLPVTILKKLAFVREKQRCAGKMALVSFELPGSVELLTIYLSSEDVHQLSMAQIDVRQRGSINPGESSSQGAAILQNKESYSPINETPKNGSYPAGDFHLIQVQADKIGAMGDLPSNIPQSGEDDSGSSYNSCANHGSQDVATDQCLDQSHVAKTDACIQDVFSASYSSSDATLTQDTPDASSNPTGSYFSKQTSSTSSDNGSSSKLSCCTPYDLNNFQQYVLYIQGYNDTVLSLVLDDACKDDPLTIHSLWKLGMNTLMSLETDVRSCLEMSPSKEEDENGDSSYLYLQYDRKLNKARGDLKVSKGSSLERQIFNRSAQLLHEDFLREPQLYEATVSARDLVIYGHKLGAKETYFHSREHSTSDHNVGFPLQSGQMCTISTKARKTLEKERRLLLL